MASLGNTVESLIDFVSTRDGPLETVGDLHPAEQDRPDLSRLADRFRLGREVTPPLTFASVMISVERTV